MAECGNLIQIEECFLLQLLIFYRLSSTNYLESDIFKAICPDSWKRGLILCLLNIAKHVCSSEDLFNLEVDKLRQMFKLNGYPLYYFN